MPLKVVQTMEILKRSCNIVTKTECNNGFIFPTIKNINSGYEVNSNR